MSRAIKIFGVGFSTDENDAEIEVKLDGNVIYSGTVVTDKPVDLDAYLAGSDLGESEVASWIEPDVASVKALSIKAVSGNFLYQASASTYIGDENITDLVLDDLQTLYVYQEETDGDDVADPNSNIKLDGDVYDIGAPEDRSELFGQWDIGIPEGSTMTCDISIGEGPIKPVSEDEPITQ